MLFQILTPILENCDDLCDDDDDDDQLHEYTANTVCPSKFQSYLIAILMCTCIINSQN